MAQGQHDAQSVVPNATGDEEDDILASLPTREGWWTTFVLYHGCWMARQTARSVSLVRAQFAPRDDDVLLATYPKCGTTWLKALSFTIANRSRHPVVGAGAGDHPLLTQSPHDLVPFIELPFRHIHPLAALDALPSPRVLGTHMQHHLLPPRVHELGCRIVYLCREPKDVIVSLWHFVNKVTDDDLSLDFDKAFEMFVDGFSSAGPIWNHYLGYWNKHVEKPDRVLFLKYDDMMADPTGHVKKLAGFLRVPFTDEEVGAGVVEEVVRLCSFGKLSRLPVNSSGVVDRIGGRLVYNSAFFRKGKVEDWKNYLTEEMTKKLDAVVEEKLKGSELAAMAQVQLEVDSVLTGEEEDESLLLSSSKLQTREGWWTTFVLYHGCWMDREAAMSVSLVRAQFVPRDDDVLLATYPKCGTTWLKALAFAVTNRFRHPVVGAGAGDHPLLTQSPHDLVPFIELPFRHIQPLAALDALPSPRLLGTHMPHHLLPPRVNELGCRIVYLYREPKDVVISTWHFMNKVIDGFSIDFDKAFELFVDGCSPFGPIWNHCLGYWNKHVEEPDRVLFLKYDDMMADPAGHVKKLAKFFRVPFTDEEVHAGVMEEVVRLCSFEKLSRLLVNSSGVVDRVGERPMKNSAFFRKGKVGDWNNYLTEEMAKKLDAVIEEKLKGSGLTL
uniref:Sulfotransferase domain-containing protein n=1 Tax=Oryza punctata TaxID=4537 RepID=A0A0E0LWV0_ORYPU